MVVIRGRRPTWKGPFFQPFRLPQLNPIASTEPAVATNTTAATTSSPLTTTATTRPTANRTNPRNPNAMTRGPATTKTEDAVQLRTMARYCTILPSFVGHTFHVHNGKKYLPVRVTEEMIGHRLGEFSFTKKPCVFKLVKPAANTSKK